ncbi:hypothetical protein [Geminisphaera colitermitum]|uniref:hypothetical protein n=1 Tax=Geminisphaera colitermitum TaxID=1148786 RepID=UPI0001965298|nr:hypothetical protein [Geminisphaera colitermitum]
MITTSAATNPRDQRLKAALYLEVVPGVMDLLSEHDSALSAALAGPAFGLVFSGWRCPRRRLDVADGRVYRCGIMDSAPQPGDLRLWFPGPRWMVRAFEGRPTLALPLGGWRHLRGGLRRFQLAGKRLQALLDDRAVAQSDSVRLALHAWGNLAAGLAAATAWLRGHPRGLWHRAPLSGGSFIFDCDTLPAPLWIQPGTLRWGAGPPPDASAAPIAHVEFAHVSVLLDEFDHRLDALAALGTGDLRITGRLPLVDQLSCVMNQAGAILRPAKTGR